MFLNDFICWLFISRLQYKPMRYLYYVQYSYHNNNIGINFSRQLGSSIRLTQLLSPPNIFLKIVAYLYSIFVRMSYWASTHCR